MQHVTLPTMKLSQLNVYGRSIPTNLPQKILSIKSNWMCQKTYDRCKLACKKCCELTNDMQLDFKT